MTRQRNTRQREVLQRTIEECGRPVSVPELHQMALNECDNLGIATVYRAVNAFLELEERYCFMVYTIFL